MSSRSSRFSVLCGFGREVCVELGGLWGIWVVFLSFWSVRLGL